MNWLSKLWGKRSPFDQIFLAREFSELAGGPRWRTIWQLAFIVFITLAALAFGIGSLNRLEKRMQSPFSNIVDMGVFYQDYAKMNQLKDTLLQTSIGKELGLDTMTTWYKFKVPFHNIEGGVFGGEESTRLATGRTMDFNSSLFEGVFPQDNIVSNFAIEEDNRLELSDRPEGGIVVTEDFLRALGYGSGDIASLDVLAVYDLSIEATYFLPVLAVVKKLPSKCDFLTSLTFYENVFLGKCSRTHNPFTVNRNSDNNIYLVVEESGAEEVVASLKSYYEVSNLRAVETRPFSSSAGQSLSQIRLIFDHGYVAGNPDYLSSLKNYLDQKDSGWMFLNRLNIKKQPCGDDTPQRVSFLFGDLTKISDFNDYLWSRWKIQLSLEEVKNRENFALVSALGYTIGIMLLLFAILSICLFMRSLIMNHLNKVKPNLGTFKAFGLSDTKLRINYRTLLITLLAVSSLAGFLLAVILDGVLTFLGYSEHFQLFNPIIYGALLLVFFISLTISHRFIRRILSHSPGDLVYGRDDN